MIPMHFTSGQTEYFDEMTWNEYIRIIKNNCRTYEQIKQIPVAFYPGNQFVFFVGFSA